MEDMSSLVGIALRKGLEGETAGTNIGNMFSRAMTFAHSDKKPDKDLKEDLQKDHGIVLEFTDKNGKFRGVENMIKEMEKLKKIKNDSLRSKLIADLWGNGEMATIANIFTNGGVKQLRDFKSELHNQAEMQDRIKTYEKTMAFQIDSLMGTTTNFSAQIGSIFAPVLSPYVKQLDGIVNSMDKWAKENPNTVKTIAGVSLAIGGLLIVGGSLGILFGALAFASKGFIKPLVGLKKMVFGKSICDVGSCIGTSSKKASIFSRVWNGLRKGLSLGTKAFMGVGKAILFMGRALLLNPIGLAVTVIAGGAYLIYKNWDKLRPWFLGLWNRVRGVFNSAKSWLTSLITNPVGVIKGIWNSLFGWFSDKFSWLTKSIGNIASSLSFPNIKIGGGVFSGIKRTLSPTPKANLDIRNITSRAVSNSNTAKTFNIKVDVHNPRNSGDVVNGIKDTFNKRFGDNHFGDKY